MICKQTDHTHNRVHTKQTTHRAHKHIDHTHTEQHAHKDHTQRSHTQDYRVHATQSTYTQQTTQRTQSTCIHRAHIVHMHTQSTHTTDHTDHTHRTHTEHTHTRPHTQHTEYSAHRPHAHTPSVLKGLTLQYAPTLLLPPQNKLPFPFISQRSHTPHNKTWFPSAGSVSQHQYWDTCALPVVTLMLSLVGSPC